MKGNFEMIIIKKEKRSLNEMLLICNEFLVIIRQLYIDFPYEMKISAQTFRRKFKYDLKQPLFIWEPNSNSRLRNYIFTNQKIAINICKSCYI